MGQEVIASDLQAAVDAGLRAQLVSQGLVSGEASVNLDVLSRHAALRAGHPEDAFEIPTIPSGIQDLEDQLPQAGFAGDWYEDSAGAGQHAASLG